MDERLGILREMIKTIFFNNEGKKYEKNIQRILISKSLNAKNIEKTIVIKLNKLIFLKDLVKTLLFTNQTTFSTNF